MKLRISQWSYINLTLAAYVFAPELRRLVDWHNGSSVSSVLVALPTFMLIPIAFFVYPRRAAIRRSPFFTPSLIWALGFLYAFIISVATNFAMPGLYGLGLFLLPVCVGAWLATDPDSLEVQYHRISSALFVYGAIAGIYGIIQFVTAPPWDTAWMEAIKADSFGEPQRFAIRVFSLMNSPGTYAEFTAFSLILNFPNMRLRQPWTIVATLIMVCGLILSLVRSAWLAVTIGAIVFSLISPRRKQAILSLLSVSAIFALSGAAFFALVPNESLQLTLYNRLNSLTSISTDSSAQARADTSRVALDAALNNLLGQGLGLTGETATLATSLARTDVPSGPIDNGFVARFLEMGIAGFAAFIFAIFLALVATWRHLIAYVKLGNKEAATILAALFATQVSIFLFLLSGDVYSGVGSTMFFIAFGLGARVIPKLAARQPDIVVEVASSRRNFARGARKRTGFTAR